MVNFTKECRKNIWKFLLQQNVDIWYHMHLVTVNPSPADDDVGLADLTEASYPGYSSLAIGSDLGLAVVGLDGSQRGLLTSSTYTFLGPTSGSPVTVYGYYITLDPAGGTFSGTHLLIAWVRLATPVVMVDTASTFERILKFLDDQFIP